MQLSSKRTIGWSLVLMACFVPRAFAEEPASAEQAKPPEAAPAPVEQPPPAAEAPPPAAAPAPAPAAAAPQITKPSSPQDEYIEEIVVTGSRIPRVELSTAAPVAVMNRARIEATGKASIGDVLQTLPEQSNAINTQFNNSGDGSTRINLRGLGVNRTLVLLNGRRHVAGGNGANSTVDLNSIPIAAIQRVEVLKDGASAVYGSDAISGVVNIITRKDYVGTEANAFIGTSNQGDGTLLDLSLTTGQVADRGNILFSGGFYKQQEVWAGDRQFSYYDYDFSFADRRVITLGSTFIPNGLLTCPLQPNQTCVQGTGTQAWRDLLGQYPGATRFTYEGGAWRPYRAVGVTDAGGDQYNYQPANYLVTPSQRVHLFSIGEYKFSQDLRGYFEASYTNRQSEQKLAPEPFGSDLEGLAVSGQSIYNPFGVDFSTVRRRLVEFGNRIFSQDLDTFRIVTGVGGNLGFVPNFTWDLSFNYGRTQGIEMNQGRVRRSKIAAAIGPSFYDPDTGAPTCGTPGAPIEGCTPLNLFGGEGSISEEQVKGLTYTGTLRGFTQQVALDANVAGQLFKIGNASRPIGLAAGYQLRREVGAYIPDPLTAAGDTTGSKEAETRGAFTVNEGYLELSLPLVPRMDPTEPGDMLEVSAAARIVHYNTFGTTPTFKLGGRFSFTPEITLRGTVSTAFRAPTINELYLGQTDGFPAVDDPCSGTVTGTTFTPREQDTPTDRACDADGVPDGFYEDRAQIRTLLGGNANLKPETANVGTLGLVYEPRAVKDLSFTLDYYNIRVFQAIDALGTDVILNSCYPGEEGARLYCDNVVRGPNGYVLFVRDPLTNVGGDKTWGLDFAARFEPETPFGRVGLDLDVIYLGQFDRTISGGRVVTGRGTYDLAAVYADWKANLGVMWMGEGMRAGLRGRWVNSFRECANNSCTVQSATATQPRYRNVAGYFTLDAQGAYDLNTGAGTTQIQVGINNILNTPPPIILFGFLASSDAATYDYMGRYFYARAVHKF